MIERVEMIELPVTSPEDFYNKYIKTGLIDCDDIKLTNEDINYFHNQYKSDDYPNSITLYSTSDNSIHIASGHKEFNFIRKLYQQEYGIILIDFLRHFNYNHFKILQINYKTRDLTDDEVKEISLKAQNS